jgi:DMSO/TMAO reductase YedYZ molybdopterin-dependent catalytic subunit
MNNRRSFMTAGIAALSGVAGLQWIRTRRSDGGAPWPLRRVLQINETLSRSVLGSNHLAPAFPASTSVIPRENGAEGLNENYDIASWRLHLSNPANDHTLQLRLDEIQTLPRVEMVSELCCIEGWSCIVRWSGFRLSSLVEKHGFESLYVSLETPDHAYYVGLDMASAIHPQTLLCDSMGGRPLTLQHGAPLRLVAPVKYGIKSIKRIGAIRFTNTRPRDYWAERGYDWYAGL